jgi:hypothetical protein
MLQSWGRLGTCLSFFHPVDPQRVETGTACLGPSSIHKSCQTVASLLARWVQQLLTPLAAHAGTPYAVSQVHKYVLYFYLSLRTSSKSIYCPQDRVVVVRSSRHAFFTTSNSNSFTVRHGSRAHHHPSRYSPGALHTPALAYHVPDCVRVYIASVRHDGALTASTCLAGSKCQRQRRSPARCRRCRRRPSCIRALTAERVRRACVRVFESFFVSLRRGNALASVAGEEDDS